MRKVISIFAVLLAVYASDALADCSSSLSIEYIPCIMSDGNVALVCYESNGNSTWIICTTSGDFVCVPNAVQGTVDGNTTCVCKDGYYFNDTDACFPCPANSAENGGGGFNTSCGGCENGYHETGSNSNGNLECKINTYTITYDTDGGTPSINKGNCAYDTDCKISSKQPTKTGFTFLGWKETTNFLTPNGQWNSGATIINANTAKNIPNGTEIELIAQWNNCTNNNGVSEMGEYCKIIRCKDGWSLSGNECACGGVVGYYCENNTAQKCPPGKTNAKGEVLESTCRYTDKSKICLESNPNKCATYLKPSNGNYQKYYKDGDKLLCSGEITPTEIRTTATCKGTLYIVRDISRDSGNYKLYLSPFFGLGDDNKTPIYDENVKSYFKYNDESKIIECIYMYCYDTENWGWHTSQYECPNGGIFDENETNCPQGPVNFKVQLGKESNQTNRTTGR